MKLRFILFPLVCLPMVSAVNADTFVLKDGTKLEGKILKETETTYELEVRIGKSIRDEKTVAKADVAEIIAEKLDETAFEGIKNLIPTPDLTSADEYARRMAEVSKFIAEYPKSAKASEAQTILSTLKTEAEAIAGGGIKLDGKMVPGSEYQANLYDIDAKILESRVRSAASRGDVIGALRGVSRLEKDYKMTTSTKAIEPLKKQLLQAYNKQISDQLDTYDKRVEERTTSLNRMSRDNRTTTERAINEETTQAEARFKADQEAGQVWVTTHPFVIESLHHAQESIRSASDRDSVAVDKDSGRIYRNILRFINSNNDAEQIKDAVSQGEDAMIPERYMKNLKDAATAKGVQF